jgi:uncharacterized protein YndB with AHSA1/START domain
MKSQNQTAILAEKEKQEIYIIREFDAPRDIVFKAYSDPDLLVQWVGPHNRKMRIDRYDPRSGGAYRYFVCNEEGREIAAFNGVIHEVAPPERIIQTFEYEGLPERGHVTLDTVTFEKLPGNRTKVTTHSVFRSVADRNAMMQSGVEKGLNDGYEKLDALLAKQ